MFAAVRWVFTGLLLGTALSVGVIFLSATQLAGAGRTNILLMGVDQRPDQQGSDPGRTDSMMLLSIDRKSSNVAAVSIPRDLWVSIPGHGEGRINSAYRTGELAKAGSGPDLARRTVAAALGTHVDRYVLIDMKGLQRVVDQIGGVDIDVAERIVDDAFPTDDYRTRRLEIPAGRQHMSGETALAYARTRHQDNDFGRMARQQQVIAAIRAKLSSPELLTQLPSLWPAVSSAVQTDLSTSEYVLLGSTARELSDDKMKKLVIGPELAVPVTGADGASLLQPNARLKSAVAEVLGERP
jgi:polyisoprenyl-teichoic acid--peptidoglycan teichoic acid transferase